jgi:hypothetical protein
MQITPSGNRRLVVSQQNLPPKREVAEQESIPSGAPPEPSQGSSSFNPMGDLQKNLTNPSPKEKLSPQNNNMKIPSGNNADNSSSDSKEVGGDFRSAYYKVMNDLGVPPRLFQHTQHADKFFHIDEEVIGRGEAKGFFILPSKTAERSISKEEAWEIAKGLGSRFGVTKMNFTFAAGNNYKFTFQVLVNDESDQTGTSLDALISGGERKAAYSKNSMIKESKSDIVESLIKRGFGGNNDS